MSKVCPHCGETSDRDNVCTWCSKSLTPAPEPAAAAPPPAAPKPIAPGPPPPRRPDPAPPARPLWPYFAGAGVTIVLVLIIAAVVGARQAAGPPPEPTDWKTMPSKTNLISLEAPGNYKFSTAGSGSAYEQITVKATKLCRVHVDGNGTKGAMSDTAAAAARVSGGDSSPNVADHGEGKFHAAQGEFHQKQDPSYQEQGEMQAWEFAGMLAAYSEYTATKKVGIVPVKLKGWRISCMGGDFGYQVWAEAPAAQWDKFEPIARRILESAKMGAAAVMQVSAVRLTN